MWGVYVCGRVCVDVSVCVYVCVGDYVCECTGWVWVRPFHTHKTFRFL